MKPLPPSARAMAYARRAAVTGTICRHSPSIKPRRSPARKRTPPSRPAASPAASPQPIWAAALLATAQVSPLLSSALARSSATRKKGTANPSLSPLSTSSAWRTRAGTDVSVTTRWPSAASVEHSIVERRKAEASAMPGNTSRPTPVPASIVSGRPMRRSRLGQPSSLRSERRSSRAASLNSSRTSATSVTRSAADVSRETSSRPSAEAPAAKPAATKNSAEVIPCRSSGPDTALQTTMMTAMLASATILPSLSSAHLPDGGLRAILQPPGDAQRRDRR